MLVRCVTCGWEFPTSEDPAAFVGHVDERNQDYCFEPNMVVVGEGPVRPESAPPVTALPQLGHTLSP